MLYKFFTTVPPDHALLMDRLLFVLEQYGVNLTSISTNVPIESPALVEAIATFIARGDLTELWAKMHHPALARHTFRNWASHTFGRVCRFLNLGARDFKRKYDIVFAPDDPERDTFPLDIASRNCMALDRICRTYFRSPTFLTNIWLKFSEIIGVRPDYLYHDRALHYAQIEQEDEFIPEATNAEQIEKKYSGIRKSYNYVMREPKPRSFAEMYEALSALVKKWVDLEDIKSTKEEMESLRDIGSYSIGKCSLKGRINRLDQLKDLNEKYGHIERLELYVRVMFEKDELICWYLYEKMLLANVNDLPSSIRDTFSKLQHIIFPEYLSQPAVNHVALTLLHNESFIKYASQRGLISSIPIALTTVIKDPCRYVLDATEDFIDYLAIFQVLDKTRPIILTSASQEWLSYGRFCRVFEMPGYAKRVESEILNIIANPSGK